MLRETETNWLLHLIIGGKQTGGTSLGGKDHDGHGMTKSEFFLYSEFRTQVVATTVCATRRCTHTHSRVARTFSLRGRSAHGAMPISLPAHACGQNARPCSRPLSCLSQERRSSEIVQPCSGFWSVVKCGAQRRQVRLLTCGDESGNAFETFVRKPTSIRWQNARHTCPS